MCSFKLLMFSNYCRCILSYVRRNFVYAIVEITNLGDYKVLALKPLADEFTCEPIIVHQEPLAMQINND